MNVVKHIIKIEPYSAAGKTTIVVPSNSKFLEFSTDHLGNIVAWFLEPNSRDKEEWTIKLAYPGPNRHVDYDDIYLGMHVEENLVRHYFATIRDI